MCNLALKRSKSSRYPYGYAVFSDYRKMKEAVYINASHDLYSEISKEVMAVLKRFSPKVEVYSIDEAFVDLTGLERLYKKIILK